MSNEMKLKSSIRLAVQNHKKNVKESKPSLTFSFLLEPPTALEKEEGYLGDPQTRVEDLEAKVVLKKAKEREKESWEEKKTRLEWRTRMKYGLCFQIIV